MHPSNYQYPHARELKVQLASAHRQFYRQTEAAANCSARARRSNERERAGVPALVGGEKQRQRAAVREITGEAAAADADSHTKRIILSPFIICAEGSGFA
jgi:hypothetical protein